MNTYCRYLMFVFTLAIPLATHADASILRVICEGNDEGAEVLVDGKLEGVCPLDIPVNTGAFKLRVVKYVDVSHERVFERDVRMVGGVDLKVKAKLVHQLTAAGQRKEAARLQAEAEAEQFRKQAEVEAKAEAMQGILLVLKEQGLEPGKSFRDCEDCPEMVVIPPGSFMMGDPGWQQVSIDYAFAAGKFEVTFAEWDACVAAGGCNGYKPDDKGWGRGNRPVINVYWDDAKQYVQWLSHKTGKTYRLLSEKEWEYAARAGTTTAYSWGDDIGSGNANCIGCGSQWDNKQTAPVGSFHANNFGLYDMHGNVWEWTEDHYKQDQTKRMIRGGSWYFEPKFAHSGNRFGLEPKFRYSSLGFRLARVLP